MNKIIENNKLIAKFMNLDEPAENCKYDVSWDWLMPVISKIESEGFTITAVLFFKFGFKINEVYKRVVEFIEWYDEISGSKFKI